MLRTAIIILTLAATTALAAVPAAPFFEDDFEDGLQDWWVFGAAHPTRDVAHGGDAALLSDPAASTHDPIGYVERAFAPVKAGELVAHFHDDLTGCRDPGGSMTQFVWLHDATGSRRSQAGVGVATARNDCHYVVRLDYGTRATPVPRTPGWHRVDVAWTGATLDIAIDGIPVLQDHRYGTPVAHLLLGDAWREDSWLGPGTAAMAFDDVCLGPLGTCAPLPLCAHLEGPGRLPHLAEACGRPDGTSLP